MTGIKKIFLDTAPIIYFLEEHPTYYDRMKKFLEECWNNDLRLVTSVITVEEYCVYPYRENNVELLNNFFLFLRELGVEIVSIDVDVAKKAAGIRAVYKDFKPMDALQLAVACDCKCDLFVSNDKQLKQYNEVKCLLVDEFEA